MCHKNAFQPFFQAVQQISFTRVQRRSTTSDQHKTAGVQEAPGAPADERCQSSERARAGLTGHGQAGSYTTRTEPREPHQEGAALVGGRLNAGRHTSPTPTASASRRPSQRRLPRRRHFPHPKIFDNDYPRQRSIFANDNKPRHRHFPKSEMHFRVRAPADYLHGRIICVGDYFSSSVII